MNQKFLKHIEWKLLRGTLILAFACIAIGFGALILSYEYKISKEDINEKYKLQLLSLASKTKRAEHDFSIYNEYLPQLQQYIDKGYIGAEKRALWIDTLHNISTDLKLQNLKYNISEQQAFNHRGTPLPEGEFSVAQSVMQIDMGLYHENDLFTLFDSLRKNANSLYHVDQCAIRRIRSYADNEGIEPNLSAQCDLIWITLRLPLLMTKNASIEVKP